MSAPTPTLGLDVAQEAHAWACVPAIEALALRALQAALIESGIAVLDGAEVSLVLTDDAGIRALNGEWRGKDKPTNVLSFPAFPAEKLAHAPMLGDIVLAFETCEREARDEGKTLSDHAAHLIVHGMLHLLGFDHETDADAEDMEARERRALATLGIADPYADLPEQRPPHRAAG